MKMDRPSTSRDDSIDIQQIILYLVIRRKRLPRSQYRKL